MPSRTPSFRPAMQVDTLILPLVSNEFQMSSFLSDFFQKIDSSADEEEMDFDGFLRVLRAEDASSLDHFEARLGHHLHDTYPSRMMSPPPTLSTVAEGGN